MAERSESDEIILKGSGKRARLEVTVDDVEEGRPRLVIEDVAPSPAPPRARTTVRPSTTPPRRTSPPAARTPAPGEPTPRPPSRPTPVYPPPMPTTGVSGPPPPGTVPPTRYIHADGRSPWWQSRSASVAAAVVLVLAIAAVVAVVATRDDGSEAVVTASLTSTKASVEDAMDPVRSATRLRSLRRAARGAQARIAALGDPDASLTTEKNRELATPAAALVATERAYLKALAGLDRLTDRRVGEDGQSTWRQLRRRIAGAAEDVVAASAAVAALELDEPAGGLGFTTSDLERTLSPVTALVVRANAEIAKWRRQRTAFREAKARAQRRAVPAIEYRKDVVAALDSYAAVRRDIAAWARSGSSYRRSNTHSLRVALRGFSSALDGASEELRSALALAPNLPLSVRRTHRLFGNALANSYEGLANADTAISTFASDDTDRYGDLTQVSEWSAFESLSSRADRSMSRYRSQWLSATQTEIGRIQSSIGVHKPTYPQL